MRLLQIQNCDPLLVVKTVDFNFFPVDACIADETKLIKILCTCRNDKNLYFCLAGILHGYQVTNVPIFNNSVKNLHLKANSLHKLK